MQVLAWIDGGWLPVAQPLCPSFFLETYLALEALQMLWRGYLASPLCPFRLHCPAILYPHHTIAGSQADLRHLWYFSLKCSYSGALLCFRVLLWPAWISYCTHDLWEAVENDTAGHDPSFTAWRGVTNMTWHLSPRSPDCSSAVNENNLPCVEQKAL